VIREYLELWRDAFVDEDWVVRLLARLALLCFHAAAIFALLMILAFTSK
jgi:hypothetical protein